MEAGLVAERRLELPLLKFRTWCLVYAKKNLKSLLRIAIGLSKVVEIVCTIQICFAF